MRNDLNKNDRHQPAMATQADGSVMDQHELARIIIDDAKIMMVDDEEINMEVLQIHLEEEGYRRFVSVSDSTQALQRIREELPDVLLLDIVMPQVSGYDILTAIRDDETLRYLPVIVLTSANDAQTKLKALKLGATDFLAKPIDASELALRLSNTLTAVAWQKRMSEVDPLTDLPNRAWFTRMLRQKCEACRAESSNSALILININRFKSINDSLGPARGDEVLLLFSNTVLECYRKGIKQPWFSSDVSDDTLPTVSRLDGDRFVAYLPLSEQGAPSDILTSLTESLINALNTPYVVSGQSIYLSISVGVSLLSDKTLSVETLINNAETAMLFAKRRNDKTFAIYSDFMDAKARELLSLENGLRTAVDNGEIFMVYQPKVHVASNQIAGAEALVRWLHPELGLISPVNFIPLAEDSGMIVSIGEWVLRESCFQARRWQLMGYKDFKIAVNVSIRQLHEPDFISTVKSALHDSELPPESLIIELTENMIMENAESNVVKLQKLNDLGAKISIDDFGTGYSSLSYLQRFPLDQLKIDRSFISEIVSDSSPAPIVKAMISLAHDLGLSVVAEGIETPEQLKRIQLLKCEEYQGYLCSKPVIATEFQTLLESDYRLQA
ncbi:putative bifunctional diguanylate cyclase/phosphodiesterase [Granulosicoccus antarcticus]|uniref:cyclic-guanylate-specific phosphodiesterase n=1 Tax=Granulosicoccus antarcticus IMCC3135 TaxID=1192854 RepID=A0A2Z2NXY6_9GAMM|nr:EAL domain-containing response regulator [Granulosicoccus antarcticus]ASJ75345.1 Phytochrome-like protein cph2 [Granulosicoccus antarcticus IMCC3135]